MISEQPANPKLRVGAGVAVGVTEAMIHEVVHAFYARVRIDPDLGPIFGRVLGDDWSEHLAKLCDFWSSVLLRTARYEGSPMVAHVAVGGIEAKHFARWLELFHETVRRLCPTDAAALFVARSELIAQSLKLGIAVSRGEFPPVDTP
ncbi:MAG: group III truncated hemoglobin [Phenylobacterium sp.]|uniref:group III truncated hemoglobin n=1 Tax=Phenylobacterium sp. TaxID=1871053 RepID=UPI002734B46C|nr:group III truncated hemoglobin [Phenylobacterium sp.]MDP3174507.1 group III truncated hemoglobin [Phenylobacterium sp.]